MDKVFTAFDKTYWDYISETWPEAFRDFKIFLSEYEITSGFNYWVSFFERPAAEQIEIFQRFTQGTCEPYSFNKYHRTSGKLNDDSGKIYEWFCKYSMVKGYFMTKPKVEKVIHNDAIWNVLINKKQYFGQAS